MTTSPPVVDQRALNDYEQRVAPATQLLTKFYELMVADLDPDLGGFGWWEGYTDAKRIALISEYLVASIQGLSQSLLAASLEIDTHKSLSTADAYWLRKRLQVVNERIPNPTESDYLAAQTRGGFERRRDAQIDHAAEHAFYHLAQAMDRLSACIIGVAGLHADILRADWSKVRDAIRAVENGGKRPLNDLGTPGRAAQEDVIRDVRAGIDSGPVDWLDWMLRQRDTLAHRAPKMQWNFVVNDKDGQRTVALLPAQPGWSEVEAMVRNAPTNSPADLLILQDTTETLFAFVDQTTELVRVTTTALMDLWTERKANPTLIIQPGSQWKKVMDEQPLNFTGFGMSPIPVSGSNLYVSPGNGHRLRASKVLDSDTGFWDPS